MPFGRRQDSQAARQVANGKHPSGVTVRPRSIDTRSKQISHRVQLPESVPVEEKKYLERQLNRQIKPKETPLEAIIPREARILSPFANAERKELKHIEERRTQNNAVGVSRLRGRRRRVVQQTQTQVREQTPQLQKSEVSVRARVKNANDTKIQLKVEVVNKQNENEKKLKKGSSELRGRRKRVLANKTGVHTHFNTTRLEGQHLKGTANKKPGRSHGHQKATPAMAVMKTHTCTAGRQYAVKHEELLAEETSKKTVHDARKDNVKSPRAKPAARGWTAADIILINKELDAIYSKVASLNKIDITEKASFIKEIVEKEIISKVFKVDDRFTFDILHAGSYYEYLKVGEADEFDIMVQMNVANISNIFKIRFCPSRRNSQHLVGFAYLEYQSHFDGNANWKDLLTEGPDKRRILSPQLILQRFKTLLSERLRQLNCSSRRQPWRKSYEPCLHGPAVKLTFCLLNGKILDVDLVLCIESLDWPLVAANWGVLQSFRWPSKQMVEKIKNKGCHVVPKVNARDQRCWRLSFSLAEKSLLSPRAIDEDKKYYRIVKLIFERYKRFLEPLCSYHLKTLFLWLRSSGHLRSHNRQNGIQVIEYLIQQLLEKVRMKQLPHFFIGHELNLFSELSDAQVSNITTCLTRIFSDKSSVVELIKDLGR